MRKYLLPMCILLNIVLLAIIFFLINSLGGWNHFLYKIQNRGLAGTYQHRTELLNKLPINSEDIVFVGNSLTAHCEWSELFQKPNIKNRGIAGDGVEGVLKRLSPILKAKPTVLCLMIGVNDLFYHDVNFILEGYESILKQCISASPETQVIVQSLLPVNNSIKSVQINNKDILLVNSGIQKLAKKYNYPFLDLHKDFTDESGKLNKQFSVDGIHINGQGYLLWRDLLTVQHPKHFI